MESKGSISPIFFLDRTHGKRTAKLLISVGMSVVLHHKWFHQEAPDPEWIEKCGEQKWVILSGDKSIETVPENRQAVIDAKCKVFFFNDTNSYPEEWAAAVIVGRSKLFEIIERNNGPLFVTIQKYSHSHISSVRFVGSGGPRSTESVISQEIVTPAAPVPPPFREPIQTELFTKKKN